MHAVETWVRLEEWRQELVRQGYASATVTAKLEAVRLAALAAGVRPVELTRAHVLAWIGDERRARWTRLKYLSHVRAWCAWAGIPDATEGVNRPKAPAGTPRPVTEEALSAMLEACRTPEERAYVTLGAWAGLRSAETARVRGDDLVCPAGVWLLHVVGKGGVEALIPVPPVVVELVRGFGVPGRLFPTATPRSVQAAIRRLAKRAGVECSSHMLRHRYGTMLYAGGRDLLMVQQLMRHSSPATTAGYAKVAPHAAAALVAELPGAERRPDGRPALRLVR